MANQSKVDVRPHTPPNKHIPGYTYDTITRRDVQNMRYRKLCLSVPEIHELTQIPRPSIYKILQYDDTHIRRRRPGRGSTYKIDRDTILKIEKEIDDNWGIGQLNADELITKYSLDCTRNTLVNAMKREGISCF